MNAQPQTVFSRIQALNETPLSQHVLNLLAKDKFSVNQGTDLILGSLIFWAQDNIEELEPQWMERVTGASAIAEMENPERLYRVLDSQRIMQATSAQEAAMSALAILADVILAR